MEERNAIIESVSIEDNDHGGLSAWLHLDFGGSGQGFGGYGLYSGLYSPNHPNDRNYCGHFIWRCMEIAGVSSWSALTGKCIRTRHEGGLITAIGHITRDKWFYPREEFKRMGGD